MHVIVFGQSFLTKNLFRLVNEDIMVPKCWCERKDGKAQRHYFAYSGNIGSISCATLSLSNFVWLEPVAASDCERYFLQSFLGAATVQKESSAPPQQRLLGIYSCILR